MSEEQPLKDAINELEKLSTRELDKLVTKAKAEWLALRELFFTARAREQREYRLEKKKRMEQVKEE